MFTVEEIKARYPVPTRADDSGGKYCVGGAFCLYAYEHGMVPTFFVDEEEEPLPFPGVIDVKDYLMVANPALLGFSAKTYSYAFSIIEANDEGRFSDAWNTLAEALAWTPLEVV